MGLPPCLPSEQSLLDICQREACGDVGQNPVASLKPNARRSDQLVRTVNNKQGHEYKACLNLVVQLYLPLQSRFTSIEKSSGTT